MQIKGSWIFKFDDKKGTYANNIFFLMSSV